MTVYPDPSGHAHPPSSGPCLVNRTFDDFEEYAEGAQAWRIETSLLDRGGFNASLLQMVDPNGRFQFLRTRMDARIRQVGEPPPGLRSICIPANPAMQMDWRHQQIDGNDLMIFPDGGELQGTLQPGFDMFIVSVSDAVLTEQIHAVHGPDADEKALEGEVFHCDPFAMNSLRQRLVSLTDGVVSGEVASNTATLLEDISADVVRAVAMSKDIPHSADYPRRRDAARQAAAYIEQHAHEAPKVGRMCRLFGVSDRTLENGFKELYGVTPKSFINAMRLNGFRAALRAADPLTTVIADLANDWGFWHIGQLAADYRRMFGELPSVTLTRA